MKSVRSFFFSLHLAAGCTAGIAILVMSVTGVLLAFERQINNWMDAPAVLQGEAGAEQPMPLNSVVASLAENGQGVPTQIVVRNGPASPVEARFRRERTLLLNPWTAEIVGQPSEETRALFGSVERIHRSLGFGMQSAFGRGITGAGNLAFLFLLLSGLYLWIPKLFTKANLKNRLIVRRVLQGRGREWNWHHVIGIWSAFPLLFIVITGVIMSYPWASSLLFKLSGSPPAVRNFRGGFRSDPGASAKSPLSKAELLSLYQPLDEAVRNAQNQVSGWRSITIDIPQGHEKTMNVSVDRSMGGQPEQVTQLVLNRNTGSIETVRHFSDNSLGSRLRAWARFIHTGEEFGLAGEIIAAVACLGAVMLVWTGLSMAVRRAIAASARARKRSAEMVSRPAGV
jgi:uncharacterized iron-regulated membrane protein